MAKLPRNVGDVGLRAGAGQFALCFGADDPAHLVVSIPAAYALSRFRFVGRGAFRQFLLVSQMLSPIVLVIGLFRLVADLGLIDNLNMLMWVYVAFNIAFCVWMLQSYFSTIPRDLEEAAWMEGAGRARTLVSFSCRWRCLPSS